VKPGDYLIDLGSGDGRIVITAAREFGTRGVGVDLNPERIAEANANAKAAGVTDKVEFRQGDLFEQDLSKATVVTMYLLPSVNEKLKPKLLRELRPGTRVVSHSFDMPDWEPARTLEVEGRTLYLWIIPEKGQQPPAAR
jgi:cyclopropane fatty-acyl-phospholipid synthase-like methyltransferase